MDEWYINRWMDDTMDTWSYIYYILEHISWATEAANKNRKVITSRTKLSPVSLSISIIM